MLERDKPLREMSFYELVGWLKELCDLWQFERCELSTGLVEIEEELERTMLELLRQLARKGE